MAYTLTDDDVALLQRCFEYAQHPVNTTLSYLAPPAALRKLADEHEQRFRDMEAFHALLNRIDAAGPVFFSASGIEVDAP